MHNIKLLGSNLLWLSFSFLVSSCGQSSPSGTLEDPPASLTQPIINGKACTASDHPATLAVILDAVAQMGSNMYQLRTLLCTGTLIAPDVALTAAHCLHPEDLLQGQGTMQDVKYYISFTADLQNLVMGSSSTLPQLPKDAIQAKVWLPNPSYNPASYGPGPGKWSDSGLIFLSKAVPDTQVTPAIVIAKSESSQLVKKMPAEIVGWGQQGIPDTSTVGLKVCATSFINELGNWEMQIGGDTSSSRKCHGDSGGPTYINVSTSLTNKMRVVGITSHAYDQSDCYKGGIDTRVDALWDWIDQEMKKACQSSQRVWCQITGVIPPDYYEPKRSEPTPDKAIVHDMSVVYPDGSVLNSDGQLSNGDSGLQVDSGSEVKKGGGCSYAGEKTLAPYPMILVLSLILIVLYRRRSPSSDT